MEDDAFLRAIREAPDDQARRLVYADWLEERGDVRGEYLRLSCRLAELRGHIDGTWLKAVREHCFREDIRLRSGRLVSLLSIRQFYVYEGLLEGLPTRALNQRIIDRAMTEERNRVNAGEPYLIRPTESPIEYKRERPYPFGEPAAIPAVGCVGRFYSSDPTHGASNDYSELVVIWFQSEFALPIDPDAFERLREIDWDRHASNYDY